MLGMQQPRRANHWHANDTRRAAAAAFTLPPNLTQPTRVCSTERIHLPPTANSQTLSNHLVAASGGRALQARLQSRQLPLFPPRIQPNQPTLHPPHRSPPHLHAASGGKALQVGLQSRQLTPLLHGDQQEGAHKGLVQQRGTLRAPKEM